MFSRILFIIAIITTLANAKIIVSVSVIPQAYFIERIAKDKVEVNIMVGQGKSPEIYEPNIKQLKDLEHSSLYFGIGIPFEHAWLKRFKSVNKNLEFIEPLESNQLQDYYKTYGIYNEQDSDDKNMYHSHKHTHGHIHAPHIWLSFVLSKAHATKIATVLKRVDSSNADFYEKNLQTFLNDIDEAFKESKKKAESSINKAFLVYHPAFSFMANELGLMEYAIEQDGKDAKIAHIKDILEIIKEQNIKTILIQPQFSQSNAKAIAKEAKITTQIADPLEFQWLENMKHIVNIITKR